MTIQVEPMYHSLQELLEIVKSFQNNLKRSFDENERHVIKRKFATSASFLLMPRGIYSPVLFRELIIDNISRGRFLRERPQKNGYYEYGFDQNGKLITVTFHHDDGLKEHEFIIYQGNRQIGIRFDIFHKLDTPSLISIAEFDGGYLKKLRIGTVSPDYARIVDLLEESYEYDADHVDYKMIVFVPFDDMSFCEKKAFRSDTIWLSIPIENGKSVGRYEKIRSESLLLLGNKPLLSKALHRSYELNKKYDIEKLLKLCRGDCF